MSIARARLISLKEKLRITWAESTSVITLAQDAKVLVWPPKWVALAEFRQLLEQSESLQEHVSR